MIPPGLRDLQYRFNKIKIKQLEEMDVPTVRWTINECDIEKRRQELELKKVYRDVYLAWKGVYEDQEFQRFGTAPVRNAYWSFHSPGPYVWKPNIKNEKSCVKSTQIPKTGATMVFCRYPNLLSR